MKRILILTVLMLSSLASFANEPEIYLPDLRNTILPNINISGWHLLVAGFSIILIGILFGIYQFITSYFRLYPLSFRLIKCIPDTVEMMN